MTRTWNRARAEKRIQTALSAVKNVEIVDYKRDTSLENIPVNKAYRMRAAHLYADIVNLDDILGVTDVEGETCHRRTLRFLNQHYRAVYRILDRVDARRRRTGAPAIRAGRNIPHSLVIWPGLLAP